MSANIEDMIRKIVREEIARCVPLMVAYATRATGTDIDPAFLRPVPRYDPPRFADRMGCTCAPGAANVLP